MENQNGFKRIVVIFKRYNSMIEKLFNERVISRACNLTPLDYFLRGYMKRQVYKNNSSSIPIGSMYFCNY